MVNGGDKMKKQLLVMLNRLKNPSVVLSIASQFIIILTLFHVNVDRNIITGIVTAICSILVSLGIMSNPEQKGYSDNITYCEKCGENEVHINIADKLVCIKCGTSKFNQNELTDK